MILMMATMLALKPELLSAARDEWSGCFYMTFDSKDIALRDSKIRKGIFKDVASDIVHTDRYRRKSGYSVDTGGTIAREMENAYKLGLAHGALTVDVAPADPSSPLPWKSIPYNSRYLFANLVQFDWTLVRRVERTVMDSKNRVVWDCIWCERNASGNLGVNASLDSHHTSPNKFVQPLLKLGLLSEFNSSVGLVALIITERGHNTFTLARGDGFISGEKPWRIE
jgi:hypothetical protein